MENPDPGKKNPDLGWKNLDPESGMKKSRSGMENPDPGKKNPGPGWKNLDTEIHIRDGKKIQIRDKDPLPGVHKTLHEGGPVLGEAEGGQPIVPCVTRRCLPSHSGFLAKSNILVNISAIPIRTSLTASRNRSRRPINYGSGS